MSIYESSFCILVDHYWSLIHRFYFKYFLNTITRFLIHLKSINASFYQLIFSRICKNIKETGCIHFDVEKMYTTFFALFFIDRCEQT